MKSIIITLFILGFIFGNFGIVWSGNFQQDLDEYKNFDYNTSLNELRTLAEEGNKVAQYNLGTMYRKGKGLPQDYKMAVKWYTLSAYQGNAAAQYNLGIMYSFGLGVVPDYKTAFKWYNLASEQGEVLAQYNLARLYFLGNGVKTNMIYSLMWVNLASSNGFEMAGNLREVLIEMMNPSQIQEAQRLTRYCVNKNYKGC